MSCEFCKHFDFTGVCVKDNSIHLAGGNTNFVECYKRYPGMKLFEYCPICGTKLCYYELADEDVKHKLENVKPIVVAVDSKGDRIDYAVFDDETTMPEDDYYMISQLRTDAGVGFQLAKEAFRYAKSHYGDYDMMIAYIKAKVMAVNTGNMPFDKRVEHFMGDKK